MIKRSHSILYRCWNVFCRRLVCQICLYVESNCL